MRIRISSLSGWLFLSWFCMISCNQNQKILPRETLRSMLLDMELAESYVQHIRTDSLHKTVSIADSLLRYNAEILKRYGSTENDFKVTMNYYRKHPTLLDSLYQDLLTDVSILQSKRKK